jgi:hypothetical protein
MCRLAKTRAQGMEFVSQYALPDFATALQFAADFE